MAFGPARVRREELLIDAVAGAREKRRGVDLGGELGDLCGGAPVALLDARPQDLARLVEQHERGRHAGDAEAAKRAGARGSRCEFAQDRAGILPPLRWILLRPTRMRRGERSRARSDGEDFRREPDRHADRRGRADVEADDAVARHRVAAQPSPLTTSMKRLTRSPSTGFQVSPSTLTCVPMTQPSAMAKMSLTLSMRTPVLAKSGVAGTASRTFLRSDVSTAWPGSGPETRIASASEEKTALLARISLGRASSEDANSALMLKSSFRSGRPRLRRSVSASAAFGCQSPMSEAKRPVKISRAKAAPVAQAIATLAEGSQR